MVKLLGKDAYEAARHQTSAKLGPMKAALMTFATDSKTEEKTQSCSKSQKNKTQSN